MLRTISWKAWRWRARLRPRDDDLSARVDALERELHALVTAHRPQLLAETGCGALTPALLIGRTAGAQRFPSDASLGRQTGTAPILCSSATGSTAAATASSTTRCREPRSGQAGSRRESDPRPRRPPSAAAPWSRGVAHEPARDHQLGRDADQAHPVPGHTELTVVDLCGGLDLEVIADATQRRVEPQRDAAAAGVQAASHAKPLPVERRAVGNEPDVRMLLGVEEVGGAHMRVAHLVVGVDAVGLYGELDRGASRGAPVRRLAGWVARSRVPWYREKRPLTAWSDHTAATIQRAAADRRCLRSREDLSGP